MANGHHIRAVGQGGDDKASGNSVSNESLDASSSEQTLSDYEEGTDVFDDLEEHWEGDEFDTLPSATNWIGPVFALALVLGWSGLFLWSIEDKISTIASSGPADWTNWIVQWSIPVLLIGLGWLIIMRNSSREAHRFGNVASKLSHESQLLEQRLGVVNRELSVAREFLDAQSRELETLGRLASERLSTHAAKLEELIKDNGEQVETIGTASDTALANMDRLRDDLPVIANSARDVSNRIGSAGNNAQEKLDKLIDGFDRLNQFGKASETQVEAFDHQVNGTLDELQQQISQIGAALSTQLEEVQSRASDYRAEVGEAEEKALAAFSDRLATLENDSVSLANQIREAEVDAQSAAEKRIEELREETSAFVDAQEARERKFEEQVSRRQEEFATREAQASEMLEQRLTNLDDALAERREAQLRETEKLVQHSQSITEQIEQLSSLISKVAQESEKIREGLGAGFAEFSDQITAKQGELERTSQQLAELTESSIRMLEIIQSGAKHSREELPEAIEVASTQLGNVEERTARLAGAMFQSNQQAQALDQYLIASQEKISTAETSLEQLQNRIADHSEEALAKLQGLRGGFDALNQSGEQLANGTQEKMREALEQLEQASARVLDTLGTSASERVIALAGELSGEAVEEVERSLHSATAKTLGQLEQAASHASGIGREATAQLRDQLVKVNELTKNLEQRIARAREQAEEEVDSNDFARRMALITDSLNSSAIDITSSLSSEVTDIAWDAYLKGDRGIFTRRAVRLLEHTEAKEIAELYQNDDEFKANVSRYIHDFEAMLRSMLSTRDGNALGVTVLGSDAGKLYVALAQAIERLRR